MKSRLYPSIPGRQFIAIVDYQPAAPGELAMEKGDVVEVLYIGDQGFWEGRVKERTGWFPSSCIQELKKTSKKEKSRTWFGKKPTQKDIIEKCAQPEKPGFRMVHLKKHDRGFGFQLRGANSHTAHIEFTPSAQFPALQYIGEVDKGGVADKVGLKAGDFVIEVNGENVANATHGHVVSLVANSGKALTMKVVTVAPDPSMSLNQPDGNQNLKSTYTPSTPNFARVTSSNEAKKAPPPPLPRSQYSSLTMGNLNSTVVVTEAQMAPPNVDTVMTIDKKVQRKRSVKSMWSDTALKLLPDAIRTEEISKGVVRRTKGTSMNIPLEQEGETGLSSRSNSISSRSSSSSPNLSRSVPIVAPVSRSLSQPPSQNGDEANSSDSQNRPSAPPNYEVTLENMRRLGRKPSFHLTDSERKVIVTVETTADTRSRAGSSCSEVLPPSPLPEPPSYSPPPPPTEEQPHITRSLSLPAKPEGLSARNTSSTSSEPAANDSTSSDEDESRSDFAKALRQVAAARKQRARGSKLSIDETINLRRKEQSLHVINENEESTKTSGAQHIPKSSSSDAILQHKEGKVLDHHSLYAASSTSSLDTQTSKDSGIDVSEVMNHAPGEQPPDLASALANAVARRAEKIAIKEPITKPVDQKSIVKNELQTHQGFHAVKLKPTQNLANFNEVAASQPASTPPPVRPKPQAKSLPQKLVEETKKHNNTAQQHTQAQTAVHNRSDMKSEIVTPPPMFLSEVNGTKDVNSLSDDLPSPPVEFLDDLRRDPEKVGSALKYVFV